MTLSNFVYLEIINRKDSIKESIILILALIDIYLSTLLCYPYSIFKLFNKNSDYYKEVPLAKNAIRTSIEITIRSITNVRSMTN